LHFLKRNIKSESIEKKGIREGQKEKQQGAIRTRNKDIVLPKGRREKII